MRASRLLQILLLLQNRGRLNSAKLARELEVTRRTILRDVDALTEAGLPIIVHRGSQGGIELGFNYRTRLTGFADDEVEALAMVLAHQSPALDELAMRKAAGRAIAKLMETFTDTIRKKINTAHIQFQFDPLSKFEVDPRIAALATAIRERRVIFINANTSLQRKLHPIQLRLGSDGWSISEENSPEAAELVSNCGDISISARRF